MNDLQQSENGSGCQNAGVTGQNAPTEPRQPGAQPGNVNRVTTGHRSGCDGVVLTTLGRRFAAAYFDLGRVRRQMRALAFQRFGGLTLGVDLRIQSICRHEASCRLAEQQIRENPKMAATDILKLRESISRWTAMRDAAYGRLFGDDLASTADPWAELDAEAERQLSEPTTEPVASNAATSAVGRQAADQASDPFAELDAQFSDNYGNADAEDGDDE